MKHINEGGLVDDPYPVADTLFFKLQGDSEIIRLTAQTIDKIVGAHGGRGFAFAPTDEAAEDMWQTRKNALASTLAAWPDHRCWSTDVWYGLPPGYSLLIVLELSCLASQFPVSPNLYTRRRRI